MSEGSRLSAKKKKQLQVLLATTLVCGAMISAPQLAQAAITEDSPGSGQYTASGTNNSTQVLTNVANVKVTTAPDFSVNTNSGHAVAIAGLGSLTYTDANDAEEITTTAAQFGIYVESTGNAVDSTPGSVTIVSNDNITGGASGVRAANSGTGSISVTLTGEVEGVADDGISVTNYNNAAGSVEIEANQVTAADRGIDVNNAGAGSTIITTTGEITAGQHGIVAVNHISGDLTITATDTITATALDGVNAANMAGTGDLTIEVDDVTAGRYGVHAVNNGEGDTTITANGTITSTGAGAHGIYVSHAATAGNITITAHEAVSSISHAVFAANGGEGDTEITTNGVVESTGAGSYGIYALNGVPAGNITVTAEAAVTGNHHGIVAWNDGKGDTEVNANAVITGVTNSAIVVKNTTIEAGALTVTATDDVIGTGNIGIDVNNSGTGNTTITGTNVSGLNHGIVAENYTSGDLDITTTGTVSGTNQDGVNAANMAGTGALTVEVDDVTAGRYGIHALNQGSGNTSITANGTVTGGNGIVVSHQGAGNTSLNTNGVVTGTIGSAIVVQNTSATSGSLTVTATDDVISTVDRGIDVDNNGTGNTDVTVGDVTGLQYGIVAVNRTSGDLNVTSTGTIAGTNLDGINAANFAGTGDLTVEANNVTAGRYGIRTSNSGTGETFITANGIVEGAVVGVSADSSGSQAIEINVDGEVRNSSLASDALAISSISGVVTLNNNGLITGAVSLGNQGNTFNNADTWNTAGGTSSLGGGVNTLDNQSGGAILAATVSGGPVNTTVTGVGTLINTGRIILQNQLVGGTSAVVGDVATFTNGGSGEFQSNNGVLFIDADLDNNTADRIAVDNVVVTGGATVVAVNYSGAGAATTGDGILVVDVDGASENDAFVLSGPIQAGLFRYDLGQGSTDTQSWFLQSNFRDEVVATGALSVLGSRTALATLSNLSERQRGGEGFSDDQDARKGVWARVYGQDTKFRSDGGSNAGFNANTWGAQAGMDLVASESENGARKYAGLYVGYATSNGDALNGSDRIGRLDVDATSVGAYFTKYSPKGWYADATAQYSKLDGIRIRAGENSLNSDGKSYAASLEFGQRFNLDKKLIPELQAQVIYQKTDIDDVTLSDSTRLAIGNLNAVTGRLGVRLSKNPEYAGRMQPWVRANLWHTLKTGATVSSQGSTSDTRVGGTSGEVQVGFALTPSQSGGWSAYVAGGYLFDLSGSEYSGWKGTLGVRKGW